MNEVSLASGSAKVDAAFDELLPLCLGASFLTGLAVTIQRALPGSEVTPLALSHRFPRARSLGPGWPCISSATAFGMRLENFVRAFPTAGRSEERRVGKECRSR